jgi:hypothetical protein
MQFQVLQKIYLTADRIFEFSIKDKIFGVRAKGEKLKPPTFRTLDLVDRMSEQEWVDEFRVGTYYGHRGSFYMTR